jgi:hypothetical protein
MAAGQQSWQSSVKFLQVGVRSTVAPRIHRSMRKGCQNLLPAHFLSEVKINDANTIPLGMKIGHVAALYQLQKFYRIV